MSLGLHTFLNTCLRILSVFGIQCMAIIGGASMIGDIPVYKAAILSGVAAVAQVLQKLAIAFADDGILSKAELDSAFNGSSTE
jgi:hypothetical protein